MDKQSTFLKLFDSGMSYSQYLERSDRHQKRMKKSVEATENKLNDFDDLLDYIDVPMKVLILAENWCGDCANGVPVISTLAEQVDNWDYRIVPRDDFSDEVEAYYTTAGRQKIPVIVFADPDGDEVNRWVERPKLVYKRLEELQSQNLPKEEYIDKYKSLPERRPPKVNEYILSELLDIGEKAAALLKILPSK